MEWQHDKEYRDCHFPIGRAAPAGGVPGWLAGADVATAAAAGRDAEGIGCADAEPFWIRRLRESYEDPEAPAPAGVFPVNLLQVRKRMVKMVAPKFFANFPLTWEAWLMIIGMTILMLLLNYLLLRFYKQFSPKKNKIVLIFGLGLISLTMDLTWLFTVVLITSTP